VSINNFFKGKQLVKYTLAYFVFIILNYVICLAPIGASYYFSPQSLFLSSFLAYCFTLFAVTVYSFIYFPKENVGGTIVANLGIIIAVLFMVAYIVIFMLYSLVGDVTKALDANLRITYILSFIPAFVIPIILSIPVIRLQVASDKPKQVINTINKSENDGEKLRNAIKNEGI
jgi:MFS family permease